MKRILAIVLAGLSPMMALAQQNNPALGLGGLFDLSQIFLTRAVLLIISLAVVWFMYNVFRYVIVDTEAEKTIAKSQMVWGIIGIFVMVSIWGLVAILQMTFRTGGINASYTTTDLKNSLPRF